MATNQTNARKEAAFSPLSFILTRQVRSSYRSQRSSSRPSSSPAHARQTGGSRYLARRRCEYSSRACRPNNKKRKKKGATIVRNSHFFLLRNGQLLLTSICTLELNRESTPVTELSNQTPERKERVSNECADEPTTNDREGK
jgi:hypothetical protein